MKKSRCRKSPVRKRSVRKSRRRKSPVRKRSVKKSRCRKSPVRKRSIRKSRRRKSPVRKRSVKKSRRRKSPARKRSVKKSRRRKSPVRKRSVRKSRRCESQLRNYYAPEMNTTEMNTTKINTTEMNTTEMDTTDMDTTETNKDYTYTYTYDDTPTPIHVRQELRNKRPLELDETENVPVTKGRLKIPRKSTVNVSVAPVSVASASLHEDTPIYDGPTLEDLAGINDVKGFRRIIKQYLSSFKLYRCITLEELKKMKERGYWDTLREPIHQDIVSVGRWIAGQKMAQYSSAALDFQKLLKHDFCGNAREKICMISINLASVIDTDTVRIKLPNNIQPPKSSRKDKESSKIYAKFLTADLPKPPDVKREEKNPYNFASDNKIIKFPRTPPIVTTLDIYPAFNKMLTDRWSDGLVKPTPLVRIKKEKYSSAQNNFRAAWSVKEVVLCGIVDLDLIEVVADNSINIKTMEPIEAVPVKDYRYKDPRAPKKTKNKTFDEIIEEDEERRRIRHYRVKG